MDVQALQSRIEEMSAALLAMARKDCWNCFAEKCVYILSTDKELQAYNAFSMRSLRKRLLDKRESVSATTAAEILAKQYSDLYDVNFYIFRAEEEQTVLEIRLDLISSFVGFTRDTTGDHIPMWHCKLGLPPYRKAGVKFDVHWELGGWRYQWNWWRWRNFSRMARRYKWRRMFQDVEE